MTVLLRVGKSASGWWVPLGADLVGAHELVVRVAGVEEVLALDLNPTR